MYGLLIIMLILSIVNIGLVIRNWKARNSFVKHKKEIDLEIMLLEGKKRLKENEKKWKETEKGD